MEDLVKYIIEKLTDHPENISVTHDGENITVLVPKAEMGKLIGKQGRIAKSIRTIVKAAAKDGERINIDINEAQ